MLRPATFARLAEVLHAARDTGRAYRVVHFDGHGTWPDLASLGIKPGKTTDGSGGTGGGGGIGLSQHKYGVSVAGPVRSGRHGVPAV